MTSVRSKGHAAAQMVVRRSVAAEQPQGFKKPLVLTNPVEGKYRDYAMENLKLSLEDDGISFVRKDAFKGKVLALCGAGPSLATEKMYPADEVWACNSAVGYLMGTGQKPTAAFGIDQTKQMLVDWAEIHPDLTYYVASTIDPELTQHIRAHGAEIVMFHNLCGFEGEVDFYNSKPWPPSYMLGTGSTVVVRAIGLAAWMGFRRVDVYGADCCFRDGIAHANGETVQEAYGRTAAMVGNIMGRDFQTRADMLMGAVDLARMVRTHAGRIRLIGDTLPVALMGMDDDYLDAVMRRVPPGEQPPDGD